MRGTLTIDLPLTWRKMCFERVATFLSQNKILQNLFFDTKSQASIALVADEAKKTLMLA